MFVGLFLMVLAVGVLSLGTIIVARWMLTPLLKAARKPPPKTQFFLSDMYVLFLQLALVGLSSTTMENREVDTVLFLTLCWLALGLVWIVGVRVLSRAAVSGALPRAVSLGFTIPAAYASSLAFWVFLLPAMGSGAAALVVFAGGCGIIFTVVFALARWAAGSAEKNAEQPITAAAAPPEERPPDNSP